MKRLFIVAALTLALCFAARAQTLNCSGGTFGCPTGLAANSVAVIDANTKLAATSIVTVGSGGTNTGTAGITAFNNITGYSAAGATGTTSTNLVFSTSANLTTPFLTGTVTMTGGTRSVLMDLDTSVFTISGGSAANKANGSFIQLNGKSNGGGVDSVVYMQLGNSSNGEFQLADGGGAVIWDVLGSGGSADQIQLQKLTSSNSGNVVCWNTSTHALEQNSVNCSAISSARFKENILPLEVDALSAVNAMEPVLWNYKKGFGDNPSDDSLYVKEVDASGNRSSRPMTAAEVHAQFPRAGATHLGFIAEQAYRILPAILRDQLVILDDEEKPQAFDYEKYSAAVLTKAIQQLLERIEVLEHSK